jgi:hypothetical protein
MAASRDRSGKPVTGSAMRGKKNSKGIAVGASGNKDRVTTGLYKAVNKSSKVAAKLGPIVSGNKIKIVDSKDSYVKVNKNKNIKKELTRADNTPPYTSRRAAMKETNLQSRLDKHPLVRNTGEQASEKKYRENRGKPVPVKPKNKKPNTVASGAAFGKKPSRPRGGMGGGGLFGGGAIRKSK